MTYASAAGTGGKDYSLTYLGLLGQIGGFAGADFLDLHYTYGCGNDFMMGQTTGASIPLPPSAILLGTGLLGLVGLRWRRRK